MPYLELHTEVLLCVFQAYGSIIPLIQLMGPQRITSVRVRVMTTLR